MNQLTRKDVNTSSAYPSWWTVADHYFIPGTGTLIRARGSEAGGKPVPQAADRLTIKGKRGSFTFINHTIAPPRPGSGKRKPAEWITVTDATGYHSFTPDKISRVLRPVKPTRARKNDDVHRAPQADPRADQADQAVPGVGRPRAARPARRAARAQRGAGPDAPGAGQAGDRSSLGPGSGDASPDTEDGRGLTAYEAGWSAWMEQ